MSSQDNNASAPSGRKQRIRHLLMIGGTGLVLIVVGYFYFTSGRYISTDNAYVKADKVMMAPEVSGTVISVAVADNQAVKVGDPIFAIDPAPFRIALAEAEAHAATVQAQLEGLKAEYRQKQQDRTSAAAEADYAVADFARQEALLAKGAISKAKLEDARRIRDASVATAAGLAEEVQSIGAQLLGNPDLPLADYPDYKMAIAARDKAKLDLDHTQVRAPIEGIIGSAPHVGDYSRAGIPLLNLVGTQNVWVEANYKETELTDVKPGQTATIEVDTYPGHTWTGTVESISPATGSEFSVLPAQNATGNWVKVVQRIAVRIRLKAEENAPVLRSGMSAHVVIDTGRYPHLSQQKD